HRRRHRRWGIHRGSLPDERPPCRCRRWPRCPSGTGPLEPHYGSDLQSFAWQVPLQRGPGPIDGLVPIRVRWKISDSRLKMADGKWQMADGGWRMADDKGRASIRTWHMSSGILAFVIWHLAFVIWHLSSGIERFMSSPGC